VIVTTLIGRKLLNEFSTSIYELTRYDQFEEIDTIDYTDSTRQGSSIVSTIGFDRDQELFAVGGVSKEIKLFDFNMMGWSLSVKSARMWKQD